MLSLFVFIPPPDVAYSQIAQKYNFETIDIINISQSVFFAVNSGFLEYEFIVEYNNFSFDADNLVIFTNFGKIEFEDLSSARAGRIGRGYLITNQSVDKIVIFAAHVTVGDNYYNVLPILNYLKYDPIPISINQDDLAFIYIENVDDFIDLDVLLSISKQPFNDPVISFKELIRSTSLVLQEDDFYSPPKYLILKDIELPAINNGSSRYIAIFKYNNILEFKVKIHTDTNKVSQDKEIFSFKCEIDELHGICNTLAIFESETKISDKDAYNSNLFFLKARENSKGRPSWKWYSENAG
jgi:hypothetical protein